MEIEAKILGSFNKLVSRNNECCFALKNIPNRSRLVPLILFVDELKTIDYGRIFVDNEGKFFLNEILDRQKFLCSKESWNAWGRACAINNGDGQLCSWSIKNVN